MMPAMAVLTVGMALSASGKAAEVEARIRLSEAWSRAAIRLAAEPETPGAASFEGAVDLAFEAARMTPDDADAWRVLLELAQASGDGFPEAVEAREASLSKLAASKPPDPVVWLSKITSSIERQRTAESRLAAFGAALSGSFRDQRRAIDGPAIDARLLFDQALLQRRLGDVKASERSMRDAVASDPSYPPPTESLAGIAVASGAGPAEVARALSNAIVARPAAISSLVALARLCLAEGQYDDADRLLAVAVAAARRDQRFDQVDELLSERVLALWGMRRHAQAADLVQQRQNELDAAIVQQANELAGGSGSSSARQAGLVRLPSGLLSVHAVLCASGRLPDASRALRSAITSLDGERAEAEGDPVRQAEIDLRKALLHATVGELADVQALLDAVDKVKPLGDDARRRFAGWTRLRGNFTDAAVAELEPVAERDAIAKLGLAVALQSLGRKEEAERALLAVVTANRSNAIGLYAADCLRMIQPKPVEPTKAGREIHEVIERMPPFVWSLSRTDVEQITCDAVLDLSGGVLGRITLDVTLHNRTGVPLSLTPTGPLETRAALLFELTPVAQPTTFPPPVVIPIDRQLRLLPDRPMQFSLDLARMPIVDEMLPLSGSGLLVRARFYTNFRMTEDALLRGFMGSVGESAVVSVPSLEVTRGWIEDTTSEIRHPDHEDDVTKLVHLAMALDQVADPETPASGEERSVQRSHLVPLTPQEIEAGWAAVNEGWTRLSSVAKAWTLSVLPSGRLAALKPLLEQARRSEDPAILTSLILRWIESPADPLLERLAKEDSFEGTVPASSRRSLAIRARAVQALLESKARAASQLDQVGDAPAVLGGTVAPEMVLPTSR